ncbi:MAG: hypothetical protein FWH07_04865 [Oscillospiraceae bacterium]|nr:hypothetical protein [Oscillospiraceae bacterium]
MARALKINCGCGYQKSLAVGGGRASISLNYIRHSFSPEELSGFERAIAKNEHDYSFHSRIAHCEHCKDIISAGVLRYSLDGKTEFIYKPCTICGKTVIPFNDSKDDNKFDKVIQCPKCAKSVQLEDDSSVMWD